MTKLNCVFMWVAYALSVGFVILQRPAEAAWTIGLALWLRFNQIEEQIHRLEKRDD